MNSEPKSKSRLTGLTVMVTRPKLQARSLANSLRQHEADVVIEPAIEILPPLDWADLDRSIQKTAEGRVSTLVFVSVNGVLGFLDRIAQLSQAAKQGATPKLAEVLAAGLAEVRVLGIGTATCEALAERGIQAQAVPGKSDSSSVADYLIRHPNHTTAVGTPIDGGTLIVRADRGSDVLPDRLNAAKVPFEQVVAYRSVDRASVPADSIRAMQAGEIDWVTVTSSAIGVSLVRLFGNALNQTKLASISPITSATLQKLGYLVAAEVTKYNMPGIVDAIVGYESRE